MSIAQESFSYVISCYLV